MADEKHKLGSARPVVAREADQPMPADEKALLDEIYERYQIFRDGCKPLHDKARLYRKVVLLEDPDQDEPTAKTKTVQLQTLISTINNMVADQMDNMPEARMEPETPEAAKTAEDITDAVAYVLSRNDFEETHQRRVHDFFVTGAAVTQITWDDEADHGRGDIAVFRWPIISTIIPDSGLVSNHFTASMLMFSPSTMSVVQSVSAFMSMPAFRFTSILVFAAMRRFSSIYRA